MGGMEEQSTYANSDQLIGLTGALLELRCWDGALVLLEAFKDEGVDAASYECIHTALADLLHWLLKDLYAPYSFRGLQLAREEKEDDISHPDLTIMYKVRPEDELKAVEAIVDMPHQLKQFSAGTETLANFPTLVSPLLVWLGHHIHHHVQVATEVCRLLKEHISLVLERIDKESFLADKSAVLQPATTLLVRVLLPALSCKTNVPYISSLIWDCLKQYPYELRFDIYRIWKGKGLGKEGLGDPLKPLDCTFAEANALLGAKAKLKRLTKENMRLIGKQLGILDHKSFCRFRTCSQSSNGI